MKHFLTAVSIAAVEAGFIVDVVHDGEPALELASTRHYDMSELVARVKALVRPAFTLPLAKSHWLLTYWSCDQSFLYDDR